MDLLALVEGKINEYAQTIISGNDKADDFAMGELGFYISLRRVLKGHSKYARFRSYGRNQ